MSVSFFYIWWSPWTFLVFVGALETGMKFIDLRWLSGGPRYKQPTQWWQMVFFLGAIAVAKQYWVALNYAKYTFKLARIKGYGKPGCNLWKYEKTRLQCDFIQTEKPGYRIQEMLRSLEAPLPKSRRIMWGVHSVLRCIFMHEHCATECSGTESRGSKQMFFAQ